MNIYSIKNEKLSFFNRPIYCESSNEALTYIQNILMSDADRALIGLRSDLALYQLGDIDFTKGAINGCRKPVKICDLEEIFATIPEDKIPRTERMLMEKIEQLAEQIKIVKEGDCIVENS